VPSQKPPQNKGPFGDFVKMYRKGLGGGVFLLTHLKNPKDKILVRIIGRDNKGRVEFDTFRIHPEIEALRYGAASAYKALTIKQFTKRFKAYHDEWAGYQDNKEWKKFLDSAYFQHLYQKLL